MQKENFKNTEEILNSIQGIRGVPAPDFFYTRLRARMEKERTVRVGRKRTLQPALLIAGLMLLLLINAVVLFKNRTKSSMVTAPSKENENLQIIATSYHINDGLPLELNQ